MLRKCPDKLRLKYAFLASLVLAAATWLLAGILGGGLWWRFGWFLAQGIFVLALASGGHRDSSTARNLGRDVSRVAGSGELGRAHGFECVEGPAGHSPTIDGLAFRAAQLPPTRQRASASKAVFRAKLKARTAAAKRARNKVAPSWTTSHVRHHRNHRQGARHAPAGRGAEAAGISRLRLGGRGHPGQRPHRAPPRRGQAGQSRGAARHRAAARHDRHRPHALGDPRQAVGAQRPSHRHRPGGDRAQRHHRELPGAEGRACGRGPPLRERHRHRSGGAAPDLASRAPAVARGGDGQGDGAAARRLRAGRAVQRPPRHPDGRAPRQLARGRLRRRRDVYRHRRAGAGALHQARDLSRGRRLGRAERPRAPRSSRAAKR